MAGIAAFGAIALAVQLFYSDEKPVVKQDGKVFDFSKTHTLARLTEITEQLELEFLNLHVRLYRNYTGAK